MKEFLQEEERAGLSALVPYGGTVFVAKIFERRLILQPWVEAQATTALQCQMKMSDEDVK